MLDKINMKIVYTVVILAVLVGLGTVYYPLAEGWSYIDAFYFSITTLTTIGFGDFAPVTVGGKIFTSIYALLGIGVMLYILSSVVGGFIFRQEKYFDKIFLHDKKLRKRKMEIKEEARQIEKQERIIKEQAKELKKHEVRIEKLKKKIVKP